MRISESWSACLTIAGRAAGPDVPVCSERTGSDSESQRGAPAVATNAGMRQELRRAWQPMASKVPHELTLPGPDWPPYRWPILIVAEVHS